MKIVIALACVLAVGLSRHTDYQAQWENFKKTYGKTYANPYEEIKRKNIYFQLKDEITAHNGLYQKGFVSYSMKINSFADMLPEELDEMLNCEVSGEQTVIPTRVHEPSDKPIPGFVDWRSKNVVTPVKAQGNCGSCWAFSATGSLEGQWALKKGKLISLSEQQLVDCARNYGNFGCKGGLKDMAFQYIKNNGGIDPEASYPYTAKDGSCAFNKSNVAATDIGFVQIPFGDEFVLKDAVANVGPIAVSIDASHKSFRYYHKGVIDEKNCSTTVLKHSVLVVGYGTENGNDYWLVKNSWGTHKGDNGYYKMSRNKKNQCDIASRASFPMI